MTSRKRKNDRCCFCSAEIPSSRHLSSPYCSTACADSVAEIRRKEVAGIVAGMHKSGDLKKLDGTVPCVDCGSPARDYDHRKYREPRVVVPVCRNCNRKRGPADDISTFYKAALHAERCSKKAA